MVFMYLFYYLFFILETFKYLKQNRALIFNAWPFIIVFSKFGQVNNALCKDRAKSDVRSSGRAKIY